MELADCEREPRDAMTRMNSGGSPSLENVLHQLFRHHLIENITQMHAGTLTTPAPWPMQTWCSSSPSSLGAWRRTHI